MNTTSHLRLCTLVCLAFVPTAFAQSLPTKAVESAVATIAQRVRNNYVFPAEDARIASHLRREYKRGAFKEARNWQAFDSLVTGSLRGFSHDGHLYVRYNPERVKELTASAPLPPLGTASTAPAAEDPYFYNQEAQDKNFGFEEVKVLPGNIGYLKLSAINISEKSLPTLAAAMRFVAHTKALVIDLRNNRGGGNSGIGSVLESYFLPKETPLLAYRSRAGVQSVDKTIGWLLEPRYEAPLFILINHRTVSAAEAIAYALRRHKRATLVGQSSAGAAYLSEWYPVNEFLFLSVSTSAPTWPGTDESWEQTGVKPDYVAVPGEEMTVVGKLINEKPAR